MPKSRGPDTNILPPYEHQPLQENKDSIRLLLLYPGRRGSPVKVSIDEYWFLPYPYNPYDAISYTWGDVNHKVPITVCESGSLKAMNVTRNCEEALQAFRMAKQERLLWIDAICINQADEAEKSKQVAKMREIYRRACQVVAWLGPATKDTHLAVNWIHTVNRHITLNEMSALPALLPGGDERYVRSSGFPVVTFEQELAFDNLTKRPWFQRLWIWQEISSNTSAFHATLRCGGHFFRWKHFCTAMQYLSGKTNLEVPENALLRAIVKELSVPQEYFAAVLMNAMRYCKCSDRRDRIYVAEALGETMGTSLKPDYTMDWKGVYIEWAKKQIILGDLTFLQYCGQSESELPSWVPDWSVRDFPLPFWGYWVNGGASPVCNIEAPRRLRVAGVRVAEIQRTADFQLSHCHGLKPSFQDETKALHRMIDLGYAGDDNSAKSASFVRALNAGNHEESGDRPGYFLFTQKQLENRLKSFLAGQSTPDTRTHLFNGFHSFYWHKRALFETQSGEYGLCPADARAGDIVVAVLGSKESIVLRPSGQKEYKVIGAAYCEGTKSGEAIRGPLPDNLNFFLEWRESGWFPKFRNKTTGSLFYNDPRLPDLSGDWVNATDSNAEYCPRWKNVKTGEIRDTFNDPRCDAEALKHRGVKVEYFVLI